MAGGGDEAVHQKTGEEEQGGIEKMHCDYEDADEGEEGKVLERVSLEYRPTYQRFVVKEKSFTQQYSHLYTQRLVQMTETLREVARQRWVEVMVTDEAAPPTFCERVINIRDGERVILVGTLFKDMPLRPSVLDEYRDGALLAGPMQAVESYVSPEDSLVLEDESGRVPLSGSAIPVNLMCTGLVVAVLGSGQSGTFVVEDWCTAGMSKQVRAPDMEMLVDYIGGHLGGAGERRDVVSRIGRVVLAGNLVMPVDGAVFKEKHLTQKQQEDLATPMRTLDLLLTQLAATVPVDVMPGSDDPTNFTLPQQPLHQCLVPRSSRYSTLRRVTNPYEAYIGHRLFLGASGQILDDLKKYTAVSTAFGATAGKEEGGGSEAAGLPVSLSLMEQLLRWRHMAPTAPDTLPCYPFCDIDPFVIRECPHVFFCGNQEEFSTCLVKGEAGQETRVISLPSFEKTKQAVLVNLKTLDATPIHFPGLVEFEGETSH